jgi:hypothetical protein
MRRMMGRSSGRSGVICSMPPSGSKLSVTWHHLFGCVLFYYFSSSVQLTLKFASDIEDLGSCDAHKSGD